METINYYGENNQLKTITYMDAMKEWIASYESKREFLRDIRNAEPSQLEMGMIVMLKYLEHNHNAKLPEADDPNHQEFLFDLEYFITSLNRAINEMGPVYDVNPNFLKKKSNSGCLINFILLAFSGAALVEIVHYFN